MNPSSSIAGIWPFGLILRNSGVRVSVPPVPIGTFS
jgi:hypothetical protein